MARLLLAVRGTIVIVLFVTRIIFWSAVARILLLVRCGTNLIVGQLWHETYGWFVVARILLVISCDTNLIVG